MQGDSTEDHRQQDQPVRTSSTLKNCRVICLLNGTEVFGQERGNIEVLNSLRRQGAEVTVGVNVAHNGGELRKYVEERGFATFSVPYGCQWSKKFFSHSPMLFPKNLRCILHSCIVLRREVRLRRATHVNIGNPLVYSFVFPYLAMNQKLRLIYRMGDIPSYDSPPNFRIWKQCFRRANRVIANSEFICDTILRYMPGSEKKIATIYNVAPNGSCRNSVLTTEVRNEGSLRVLFVGQIGEFKGVHHFVDSAISLAAGRPEWQFDIVGGSMYSQDLELALQSKVMACGLEGQIRFHGSVPNTQNFYRQALVTVVPSLCEEGAANVVLEAKREGIPTIVYPSGGLPELVSDGLTGWVCATKQPNVLRQSIQNCLLHPEVCRSMRSACLEEYRVKFGPLRYDRQWADIYNPT